jgi:O-antigen/teichoic acid export membrane protein
MLKSKLFQSTMIYGITNALYSGIPLLILPFIITFLEPAEYGKTDLFRTISMVLTPVLGFSTVQSISYYYLELTKERFKTFVSSIQLFQLFTAIVAFILLTISSYWISKEYYFLLSLCVLFYLFNQFTEGILTIFRIENKPIKYMTIRISSILIELLLMVVLYKYFKAKDWTVRVYPIVLTSLIIAIYSFYLFRKMGYNLNFSKALLSKALIYSTPLILHMLSGYVLNIGDRFFIKFYLSDKELGEYAVAYQIGMSVNFFFTSFNLAWTPTYFKWMRDKQIEKIKKVRNLVYISIIGLGIFIFGMWKFISPFVIQNTNYSISLQLVLIILVSNIIFSLYKYESNYFFYSKKTKILSYISFTSAVIATICNIILIKYIGILGAAYSTLISFIYLYFSVLRKKKSVIYSE